MPRIIITVPEKSAQPYRFQLDRQSLSLGRGSDNDIVIDSGSVSARHAEMHRREGQYELVDAGSTNGIKLDGARHKILALRNGMTVKLGDVAFDFSLTDEEMEVLGREKPVPDSPISKEPEIELEERPRRKAEAKPASEPVAETRSSGLGVGMIVLFLILAAAAFFAGLSIRYQKETGEPLINAISNKDKDKVKEKAPVEETAE